MMKKSKLKLAVRRDTLRVLAGMELIRVAGGDSAGPVTGCPNALADSGGPVTGCPNPALADSANPVTGCPVNPRI